MRNLLSLFSKKENQSLSFNRPVSLKNEQTSHYEPITVAQQQPELTGARGLKSLLAKTYKPQNAEEYMGGSFQWENTGAHPEHFRTLFEQDNKAYKSLKMLNTYLDDCGEGARRVAVVSSESGVAASAIALGIGRKLSDSAMRCLAIDMSISNPILSQITDVEANGLTNLLSLQCGFADCLQGDDQSRLNIMTAGTSAMTLEVIFTHRRMDMVFDAISQSYERIIMDFGALNTRYYADNISKMATAVVIVGMGDEKHKRLIELYQRYSNELEICVMMADAAMDEPSSGYHRHTTPIKDAEAA